MRKLIILFAIAAAILAAVWIGIQSLMARQLDQLARAGTGFQAEAIQPLRDPRRIGVRLTAPRLDLPEARIALPEAVLSLAPLAPTTLRLDLPPVASLDLGSGPHQLGLSNPEARIRLLALSGLAPGSARIASGPMTIDGQPLASSLSVVATQAELGAGAPPAARVAYDLNWALAGLDPAALPRLAGLAQAVRLQGTLGIEGHGRLWLDKIPTLSALETPPTPLPVAIRIDNANLRINQINVRIVGMLEADQAGRASGALALYTSDPDALMQAAADAGMFPPAMLRLGQGMIRNISALPVNADQVANPMTFPEPAKGELRLPISFADGQMKLGPIPLGPAPLLRP